MVCRWQILGVAWVRRPDYLNKSAETQTQGTHQFLIYLRNQLMLSQVLLNLSRHQFSLLLVSEGEILGYDLKVLLVDILKVSKLGSSTNG